MLIHDHEAFGREGLAGAVLLACRLVRASEPAKIRSVTVVGGRRLTGAELLCLREEAEESDVFLTMDTHGTVILHRGNTPR
jgi:hypothetical protein